MLNKLLQEITSILCIKERPVGTCFFIDSKTVLTCKHCLPEDYRIEDIKIRTYDNKIYNATNCECKLNSNKDIDIQILRIREEGITSGLIPVSSAVSLNDKVMICSYKFNHNNYCSVEREFEFTGYYKNKNNNNNNNIEYMKLTQDKIEEGNSGSPILNLRTGFLCGILVATEDTQFPQGGYGLCLELIESDEYIPKNYYTKEYQKWKSLNPLFKKGIGLIDNTCKENHFLCIETPYNIGVSEIYIDPNYTIKLVNDNTDFIPQENFMSDIDIILQEQRILFIEGPYGCGKTVLSKRIQQEYLIYGYDTIYINSIDLNTYEYINGRDLYNNFKERVIREFKTLIIFDGIDELNLLNKNKDSYIQNFTSNIGLLIKEYQNIYILINTRNNILAENIYNRLIKDNPQRYAIIKINGFRNDEINKFLDKWRNLSNGDNNFNLTCKKLRSAKTLKHACENPLMLMWICITVQRRSWEEVQNFYSVYESFIEHTIKGKFNSFHSGIEEIVSQYRIFLQYIAKEIALIYSKDLFRRRSIYEFNISNEPSYEVAVNINIDELINKIIDPETLSNLSKSRLKENLLICYFLERTNNKWKFKDNNIIYFFLAEIFLNELRALLDKYTKYTRENETDVNLIYNAYGEFKNNIAIINQISLDYILLRLKSKNEKEFRNKIFKMIKYLFERKILFNIDEMWLKEFDEKRINSDISIAIIYLHLIENDYDISYFFKRLSWIVSAAKVININYYNLVKRFCQNIVIRKIEFRRINLSGFNFSNSIFDEVQFIQCKIFNTLFKKLEAQNKCKFLLCDFYKTDLLNINGDFIFENCKFSDIKITDSQNSRFTFIACTIENLIFSGDLLHNIKVNFDKCFITNKLNIQNGNKGFNLEINRTYIQSIEVKAAVAKEVKIKNYSFINCSSNMYEIITKHSNIDGSSTIKQCKYEKHS